MAGSFRVRLWWHPDPAGSHAAVEPPDPQALYGRQRPGRRSPPTTPGSAGGAGLPEAGARTGAQREFGVEAAAYHEEVRRPPQLADLSRTFRFAFRSLARSPGFSLLAVVTPIRARRCVS